MSDARAARKFHGARHGHIRLGAAVFLLACAIAAQASSDSTAALQEAVKQLQSDRANRLLDPEDLSANLSHVASLYEAQGQFKAAEALLAEALAIDELINGKESRSLYPALMNLAGNYVLQGKPEAAEPLYLRLLAILTAKYGADSVETALPRNGLATVYRKRGKLDEAERELRIVTEAWLKLKGRKSVPHAFAVANLAAVLADKGQHKEAEAMYLESLKILRRDAKDSGNDSDLDTVARLLERLGRFYATSEPAKAARTENEARELRQRIDPTYVSRFKPSWFQEQR